MTTKHILELPWELTHHYKNKYNLTKTKNNYYQYTGTTLPHELTPFTPQKHSLAEWTQNETNNTPHKPTPTNKNPHTPRPDQEQTIKKIIHHYNNNTPGFLLASATGTGKTLIITTTLTRVINNNPTYTTQNPAKTLIVCPKNVIPVWQQTIQNTQNMTNKQKILIINYEQLLKLITPPKTKKQPKKRTTQNKQKAKNGTTTINWNYIIFDEAHYLKNYPKSQASLAATTIAQLNKKYQKNKTPFIIHSTATPGATPLNLTLMSNILAPLITNSPQTHITPQQWPQFLQQQKFHITKTKTGYQWATTPWYGKNSTNPKEQQKYQQNKQKTKQQQKQDAQRIGKALTQPNAPFQQTKPQQIHNWPEQQLIPLPLTLTGTQKQQYDETWTTFRNWLNLPNHHKNPQDALTQMLRYRQKASLLKTQNITQNILHLLQTNNQIYINLEFLETLDTIKQQLQTKNIPVSEYSGRNTTTREQERQQFQTGQTQIILATSVAGYSLHANETLPNNQQATPNPRITIIADIRQNNLDTTQALGRCHRNGQNSITYIPYLQNTIEQQIVNTFIQKTTNMKNILGENPNNTQNLEQIFTQAAQKHQ